MPVPGQEFGNAPRRMVSDAGEQVGDIVLWVESVELGVSGTRHNDIYHRMRSVAAKPQ